MPFFTVYIDMFLILSFLGTSSETRVGNSDKAATNVVDTKVKTTQPELEAPATTAEELQASGEIVIAVIEETSSSITDMIEELSQAGGSEVPLIKAGGVSISAEYVVEGPSQPEDSHKKVSSPALQPGETQQKSYSQF